MTEQSDRYALPLLNAGQAQKELYHNEALAMLDMLTHATVEGHDIDTPPSAPSPGQCWIVGNTPSGAWTGHAGTLAGWTSGGWRFVPARAGMVAWDTGDGYWLHHDGSAWIAGAVPATSLTIGGLQVIGSRQGAIPDPTGGSLVDVEARSATASILAALRAHGLIAP